MASMAAFNSYFSEESGLCSRLFYVSLAALSVIFSGISVLAPVITPDCDLPLEKPLQVPKANGSALVQLVGHVLMQGLDGGLEDAPNPSYQPDPCRWYRYPALLGMNKWEADMSRRLVMSILMGSIIGFERRRADRPAGIRTMAMVCLGSCAFTLGSMYAFVDGTMGWDASRVSAAIPSGVGFLGAASIWKGTKSYGVSSVPEVHGLTTATSVWLSAAVGILCGGGLYVPGLFATSVGIVYLRFAPRLRGRDQEDQGDEDQDDLEKDEGCVPLASSTLTLPLLPMAAKPGPESSQPNLALDRIKGTSGEGETPGRGRSASQSKNPKLPHPSLIG